MQKIIYVPTRIQRREEFESKFKTPKLIQDAVIVTETKATKSEFKQAAEAFGWWLLSKIFQCFVWLIKLPFVLVKKLFIYLFFEIITPVITRVLIYVICVAITLAWLILVVYTKSFVEPLVIMGVWLKDVIVFVIVWVFSAVWNLIFN